MNVHAGTPLEHKVTTVVIAAMPMILDVDPGSVMQRVAISLCGGLGAFLAICIDKPKDWLTVATRIAVGVVTCFLFGPWLAARFGMADTIDSICAAFGVLGLTSWFVMASLSRMRWSDILSAVVKAKFGFVLPGSDPEPAKPAPKPPEGV